jgi:TDG/mug DNA glycosylase family protein
VYRTVKRDFPGEVSLLFLDNETLMAATPRANPPAKPTPAELQAAAGRTIPDLVRPGLKVLFVGINPGLYSGATGHHFAYPGNRFWPALHLAGITPRRLDPSEEQELLALGYGITGMAQELTAEEYRAGARRLEESVRTYQPRLICFLGLGAYRTGFQQPKAQLGLQPQQIEQTPVWLLPNPSGLNAHFSLEDFGRLLAEVRAAVEAESDA